MIDTSKFMNKRVRLEITYMQASYQLRRCSTLVHNLHSRTSKGLSVGVVLTVLKCHISPSTPAENSEIKNTKLDVGVYL
jgi:hypothetical protein